MLADTFQTIWKEVGAPFTSPVTRSVNGAPTSFPEYLLSRVSEQEEVLKKEYGLGALAFLLRLRWQKHLRLR